MTCNWKTWSSTKRSPCKSHNPAVRETEPHDNASGLPGLWPNLTAPARWRVVDLISDLHLQLQSRHIHQPGRRLYEKCWGRPVFIFGRFV